MHEFRVYGQSIEFVKKTTDFLIQNRMPFMRIISDQLVRAVLSIPLNISEGYGSSRKRWENHLKIATGSANEAKTIFEVIQHSFDIDTSELREESIYIGKRLALLRKRASSNSPEV